MQVKTIKCLITLGTMTVVSKTAWPWEAEVLQEKYGGQCEFNSEGEAAVISLPDAESEFVRLQDAHGADERTGVAHVENAFGRGKAGLKELAKSIKASKVKPKPRAAPKVKKTPAKPAAKKPEIDSKPDPLK